MRCKSKIRILCWIHFNYKESRQFLSILFSVLSDISNKQEKLKIIHNKFAFIVFNSFYFFVFKALNEKNYSINIKYLSKNKTTFYDQQAHVLRPKKHIKAILCF